MTFLRDWILGITAAALAIALAQALTPAGTVKKVGSLLGGMVLLLAALRPVLALDVDTLAVAAANYAPSAAPDELGQEALKSLIAEKTAAYIVDKGARLGAGVTAQVELAQDGSGWPVPYRARISGTWTEQQRQALEQAVSRELDIPPQRQSYTCAP